MEAICSGLLQIKKLSLGNTASANNYVAVSSGSAVDQDMVDSGAIFSLNCVSYWSRAYGLKWRLVSIMQLRYQNKSGASCGFVAVSTEAYNHQA